MTSPETNDRAIGFFITFEGGEGVGKTTLIDGFTARLQQLQVDYLRTREPGGTPLGEELRHILLQGGQNLPPIAPKAELLLFLAARAQQLQELIVPALASGKVVIADRFNDSTVAYQGYARGLGAGDVQHLCNWVCGTTQPDLTFLLSMDPKDAFKRTHHRSHDRLEQESGYFHQQVHDAFLALAQQNKERIVTIDAAMTAERVLDAVWQHFLQRFQIAQK